MTALWDQEHQKENTLVHARGKRECQASAQSTADVPCVGRLQKLFIPRRSGSDRSKDSCCLTRITTSPDAERSVEEEPQVKIREALAERGRVREHQVNRGAQSTRDA